MKRISIGILVFLTLLAAVGPIGTAKNGQDGPRKFDEFTGPDWEGAMARLDNFAVNLQNDPAAVGVVFVYGGQRRRRGEAQAWFSCLKDYLLKRRGMAPSRVTFLQGGYRENLTTELWIAPSKQQMPTPTATIKPAAVKFAGRRITKWRSLCNL